MISHGVSPRLALPISFAIGAAGTLGGMGIGTLMRNRSKRKEEEFLSTEYPRRLAERQPAVPAKKPAKPAKKPADKPDLTKAAERLLTLLY